VEKPRTRCAGCEAPIQFKPGAGSRLCPFCGHTNLVREQRIAALPLELKTDELFRRFQRSLTEGLPQSQKQVGLKTALDEVERLLKKERQHARLAFYRACILLEMGYLSEATYAFIDLTGMDATQSLRADAHSKLAEALLLSGQTEEAMESVDKCLKILKGHPGASFTQAKILVELALPTKAVTVLEETLAALGQDWKITYPPQRSALLLLLSSIHIKQKQSHNAVVPLENLLIQETAAPLHIVAEAARLLGFNYLESHSTREEGMTLIRHAALLDPANRLGMLDALRIAVVQLKGNVSQEIENLQERRKEILAEIRQVFSVVDNFPLADMQDLVPDIELTSLNSNPDRRIDLLEGAASRLGLKQFDRGTLYPLRTIEDFRRWVVAWRMRGYLRRVKHDEVEEDRLVKLKAAREATDTRASYYRQKDRLEDKQKVQKKRRKSILRWVLLSVTMVILLLALFVIFLGDRFLEEFEGKLVRVDCTESSCNLVVAAGKPGRARYEKRAQGGFWSSWLDSRVQVDGTILFPLELPWGNLDPEHYRKCIGRKLTKARYSFTPKCD
jgi:tetratricopeptide (TPR) repeat protein